MRAAHTPNVLPLTRSQWSALVAATARELGWGLRAVSCETRIWRERAAAIPDPELRRDALHALDHKRGHTDGAAMFWTLPRRRSIRLLRALVRYELLQDFLDSVTEHDGSIGPENAEQLYCALADALDRGGPLSNYFVCHPGRDDGGYLATLVQACREECSALPGYPAVRPLLLREAERSGVLVINHDPRVGSRDERLRRWTETHFPEERHLSWYELSAAASGWITTHALLALAARSDATAADAEAIHAAYFPWLALALTLLDSYVDRAEDAALGNHNYLDHFDCDRVAARRLRDSIGRAANGVLALPDGERHAVLLGCMIALYLSKDSARTPELRATTASIAAAGGSLSRLLLPILRAWRVCNGQRRST